MLISTFGPATDWQSIASLDSPIAAWLGSSAEPFAGENHWRQQCLVEMEFLSELMPAAQQRAQQWLSQVSVEGEESELFTQFLQQYSLSTDEGVALMALAESLLRIPNSRTAERLIRDKISHLDWSDSLGDSSSSIVNASKWGLLLTGKWLNIGTDSRSKIAASLSKRLRLLGEPVVHSLASAALTMMGQKFVLAETIEQALERAGAQLCSFDMLGESALNDRDARHYYDNYCHAIDSIGKNKPPASLGVISSAHGNHGISIKITALHPRCQWSQRQRLRHELLPRLKNLALLAKRYDLPLTIDAETCALTELSLEMFAYLCQDSELDGWQGLGIAVQAYQVRALSLIEQLHTLARKNNRFISVRLVKGAYWDSEIKWAQQQGLESYPVFTRKENTDLNYLACAEKLLQASDCIYPQFASHNALTLASVATMAERLNVAPARFEFQRLQGMGRSLHLQLAASYQSRNYAPIGTHKTLLAYLVRRMLENGANSSFVSQQCNPAVDLSQLLQSPFDRVLAEPILALPSDIFSSARINSLGPAWHLGRVQQQWQQFLSSADLWTPEPPQIASMQVVNPANKQQVLAQLPSSNIDQLLASALQALPCQGEELNWHRDTQRRVRGLRSLADLLQQNLSQLALLCVRECGKTLLDSIDEIREAVDFCRYYAEQAERIFSVSGHESSDVFRPRGLVVCISPWNFPVAIFTGQIVAALAVGNRVIAKPASAAVLTATYITELMRAAGIDESVMQLCCATAVDVATTLLTAPEIDGVLFTGSAASANSIYQQLANRNTAEILSQPPLLVAETGGQNAMVVDASALPEQVVKDVLRSAFNSAGQRCSALRILYLQEDIADDVIAMLTGAMAELVIGDPAQLQTDIGPLIDRHALAAMQAHVQYLDTLPSSQSRLCYRCEIDSDVAHSGYFFAPCAYEIESQSLLGDEVFGPILHIVRYQDFELPTIVDAINASGYGLTLAIHSRIESTQRFIAERARVGNIYINRDQVGAVVGCQPFGGMGLSGTGPKAGGPNYLSSLVAASTQPISTIDQHLHFVPQASAENTQAGELAAHSSDKKPLLRQLEFQPVAGLSAAQRLHALEQLLVQIEPQLQALARDAGSGARFLFNLRLLQSQALDALLEPVILNSVVGESNRLEYLARGNVLLLCRDSLLIGDWLLQLCTALVAGNSVTIVVTELSKPIVSSALKLLERAGFDKGSWRVYVPAHLNADSGSVELQQYLLQASFDLVVDHPDSTECGALVQLLAQREGAVVALYREPFNRHSLMRYCVERCVSVDTTACGGNIELLNQ